MQHRLAFWTHSPLAKSLVIVWGKRDLAQVTALCPSIDVHQRLQRRFRATDVYFRFNVERDVGDIGLEDWKMAEEIAAHTMAYLAEQEADEKKTTCVKCLVGSKQPFL